MTPSVFLLLQLFNIVATVRPSSHTCVAAPGSRSQKDQRDDDTLAFQEFLTAAEKLDEKKSYKNLDEEDLKEQVTEETKHFMVLWMRRRFRVLLSDSVGVDLSICSPYCATPEEVGAATQNAINFLQTQLLSISNSSGRMAVRPKMRALLKSGKSSLRLFAFVPAEGKQETTAKKNMVTNALMLFQRHLKKLSILHGPDALQEVFTEASAAAKEDVDAYVKAIKEEEEKVQAELELAQAEARKNFNIVDFLAEKEAKQKLESDQLKEQRRWVSENIAPIGGSTKPKTKNLVMAHAMAIACIRREKGAVKQKCEQQRREIERQMEWTSKNTVAY